MPQDLGVMGVAGEDDQVPDASAPERLEHGVPFRGEAGSRLREAEEIRTGP